MIQTGYVKLMVDIGEFILSVNSEAALWRSPDQDNTSSVLEEMNLPFIRYVEGSYFGDVDVLFEATPVRGFERDSTAIAQEECHFFMLSREVI
jgi:hypothetical protein